MSQAATTTVPTQNTTTLIRPQAVAMNATFKNQASFYVTLEERLAQYTQNPDHAQALKLAQHHWRVQYKDVTSWDQITLGQAHAVPLSLIQIDTTLQRGLDIAWVARILQNFCNLRVMPICVYQDDAVPSSNMYTCWDGQHTAICLYIICKHILKLDPSKCMVPAYLHPVSSRAPMRENFTELNGAAKKPVSAAEMFRQQVLGVRVDRSQRPEWKASELKQSVLEKYNLFVCDEANIMRIQPGAITNMSEILATHTHAVGKAYKIQDLELFCALMDTANLNRPVQSKEMWQWMDYFRECRIAGIQVDATYLSTIVQCVNMCFGSFDSKLIYDRARHAYTEWFMHDRPHAHGTAQGTGWRSETRKELHVIWLKSFLDTWSTLPTPPVPTHLWSVDAKWMQLSYLRA
jgi:hypothetical protein